MDTARHEMSKSEVAQVLDLLAKASDLTDIEIAKRVGMTRNTWRNKKQGRTELTLTETVRVSAAFGVPVELFMMPCDQAKQWVHDRWELIRAFPLTEYSRYSAYIDLTHSVHQGQEQLPFQQLAA